MDDREPETDPGLTASEEIALVRGWLRLADDVLKTPTPEEKPESDATT